MNFPVYHPFKSAKAQEEYLASYDLKARQWPIASETRMIETSYGQTFVRISGAANGKPLVLLPGASANSLMWIENIEALSAEYKTIAVDNIYDYGRSVYTRPIKNPDDFMRWLDELITNLDLGDQIYLMGMSYGAWLASQYAVRYPDHLAKVVLMAPPATVLPMRFEFWVRAILSVFHRRFLKSFLNWILLGEAHQDADAEQELEKGINEMLLASKCFKPKAMPLPTVLTDEDLQGIHVPMLFIAGENEKMYSAQKAVRRLQQIAPQIKTAIIPAGHALSQVELINGMVLNFLSNSNFDFHAV